MTQPSERSIEEQTFTPHFEARIKITDKELDEAGSLGQAVQNAIGPSGAEVIEVLGVEEALQ